MSEARLFKGGVPYAPEVRRLSESFPVPELTEGRLLRHEVLEGILDISRATAIGRYYGVVNSWIHKMKYENAIIMVWEAGEGVKVLNPAEVLEHAETKIRQKSKQLVKNVRWLDWVDKNRLDETGRRRYDHEIVVGARIADAARLAQKELAVELAPVRSLPKRIA